MPVWRIVYFPRSGERHSPEDYIEGLSHLSEKALIRRRLETLSELQIGDWPEGWVKVHTGDIRQLYVGPNRILFCLDHRTIVVLHAFRKSGHKTGSKDTRRAINHYNRYIELKEG
jgi:phage-related protein